MLLFYIIIRNLAASLLYANQESNLKSIPLEVFKHKKKMHVSHRGRDSEVSSEALLYNWQPNLNLAAAIWGCCRHLFFFLFISFTPLDKPPMPRSTDFTLCLSIIARALRELDPIFRRFSHLSLPECFSIQLGVVYVV